MYKKTKKLIVWWVEKELLLILAVVVLLGILIGYSLAAANFRTEISAPPATQEDSLLRAGMGEADFD